MDIDSRAMVIMVVELKGWRYNQQKYGMLI